MHTAVVIHLSKSSPGRGHSSGCGLQARKCAKCQGRKFKLLLDERSQVVAWRLDEADLVLHR